MSSSEHLSLREYLRADWEHLQNITGTQKRLRFWHLLSPRFAHVAILRASLGARRAGWTFLAKFFSFLLYFGFRVELNTHAQIGPGLVLPHPMGIVIGAHRIGSRALIYQNVTLGAKSPNVVYDPATRPHLGNNVVIGSGAVVVGGISLGDNCVVAANSLVTRDIESNTMAIGVPAEPKAIQSASGTQVAKNDL